jgi:superfamily II DNA or RNA helicase
MKKLKPWALGPFELLEHAEGHLQRNTDIDKRLALVSFDNAIEFSIITYLTLNPIQRKGQTFPKANVEQWLRNFHTKIEFFEEFVTQNLGSTMYVERDEIIFFHQLRNELYHNGNGFVPAEAHLDGIRKTAIWVFSTLFDTDANEHLCSIETSEEATISTKSLDAASTANFLEISIILRKAFETLSRHFKSGGDKHPTSLLEEWRELANSVEPEVADSLTPLVQEADLVRNAILDGAPLPKDSRDLDTLSKNLEKVVELTNSLLRDHQIAIVEKAIQVTSKAYLEAGNRNIGIFQQALGSGLSLSILAYLMRARFLPQLSDVHILVVADRRNSIDQLFEVARQHIGESSNIRYTKPTCKASLEIDLSSIEPTIIFTTVQLLVQNNCYKERIALLVGYELASVHEKLKEYFFGVARILFTNSPPIYKSTLPEFFGETIANYGFKVALNDGYVVPVKYERRTFHRRSYGYRKDDEFLNFESGENSSKNIDEEYLSIVTSDLMKHFSDMQVTCDAKGMIVVPNERIGEKVQEICLSNRKNCDENSINLKSMKTLSLINSGPEKLQLIREFSDPESTMSMLICTQNQLIGFDLPNLNVIYVPTPITNATCHQLISKISRTYPGKQFGLIVDYVGLESNFHSYFE